MALKQSIIQQRQRRRTVPVNGNYFRKEENMDAIKQKIYELTETELKAANEKFPLFASSHEAYGVIFE